MLEKKKKQRKKPLNLCSPQPTRPASSQTQTKQKKIQSPKQNSGVVAASSATAYAGMEVGTELSTWIDSCREPGPYEICQINNNKKKKLCDPKTHRYRKMGW